MKVNSQLNNIQFIKITKDPFKVEKIRHILAINGDYETLKKSYTAEFAHIKNLNTGRLWDIKNHDKYTYKSNPMAIDRIGNAAKWIKQLRVKNILDIGFGPADLEKNIYKYKQISLVGIDISRDSVSSANKSYPDFKFIVSDLKKYFQQNKIENKFDCVILLEVMEHIEPKYTLNILQSIYSSLKKNGYILISVPLNEGLKEMIKYQHHNPNAHVRVYTPQLLKAELLMSAYKVIKSKTFYAYHNNYFLKTFLSKNILFWRKPNNILILARKS